MTGSPSQTSNCPHVGRWMDIKRRKHHPWTTALSNKVQIPRNPHKGRPDPLRSAAGLKLRSQCTLRGRAPAPKSGFPLPRYQHHVPREGAGNNKRTPFPQTARKRKLPSTGFCSIQLSKFPISLTHFPAESDEKQQPKRWLGRHTGELSNKR